MVNFNSNSNYFHLVVFCTSRWFRRSVFGLPSIHLPFAIRLSFLVRPKERGKIIFYCLLLTAVVVVCEAAVKCVPIIPTTAHVSVYDTFASLYTALIHS